MIKKIGLILLVFILAACQKSLKTPENKTKLISEFSDTLKKGDFDKLSSLVNVDTKISVPNPDKIDEKVFIESIYSDLEMTLESQKDSDYVIVKNYDMNQLIKEAKTSIITIEGRDTTRNAISEDEKKVQYLKRIEEVKKSISKTEIKLKVEFVEEDEKLKLNFEDKETLKLFNASLGIK